MNTYDRMTMMAGEKSDDTDHRTVIFRLQTTTTMLAIINVTSAKKVRGEKGGKVNILRGGWNPSSVVSPPPPPPQQEVSTTTDEHFVVQKQNAATRIRSVTNCSLRSRRLQVQSAFFDRRLSVIPRSSTGYLGCRTHRSSRKDAACGPGQTETQNRWILIIIKSVDIVHTDEKIPSIGPLYLCQQYIKCHHM